MIQIEEKEWEKLRPSLDANVEAVVQKHRRRATVGLVKYGVTTSRTDLSITQWLQHLQDELMDAAIYVQRLIEEIERFERDRTIQADHLSGQVHDRA